MWSNFNFNCLKRHKTVNKSGSQGLDGMLKLYAPTGVMNDHE